MNALTFSSFGSSEVPEYAGVTDPCLKKDEILVEMKAIGLELCGFDAKKRCLPGKGKGTLYQQVRRSRNGGR